MYNEHIEYISDLFESTYGIRMTKASTSKLYEWFAQFGEFCIVNAAMIACRQYDDAMLAFHSIPGIAFYTTRKWCKACRHCGLTTVNGKYICEVDGWVVSPEVACTCSMYEPTFSDCRRV